MRLPEVARPRVGTASSLRPDFNADQSFQGSDYGVDTLVTQASGLCLEKTLFGSRCQWHGDAAFATQLNGQPHIL